MNIVLFTLLFYIISIIVYWLCVKCLIKINKKNEGYLSSVSNKLLVFNFIPWINLVMIVLFCYSIINILFKNTIKKTKIKLHKISKKIYNIK